jgi:hypothetical protein
VTAAVGAERIDRRDHRISPVRYDGVTAGWTLGLERRGPVTMFAMNVGFIEGDLVSNSSGGKEHLRRETMDASLQLRVRPNLFAGLELGVRNEQTEHSYPHSSIPETFDIVAASLSPVVTWVPAWRDGTVRIRGSLAAVTVVDREYSRTKAGASVDEIAGPLAWSSGTLEVSRVFRENARVSWRVAGRASAWNYRTEIGAANVEMRASAGGRVRLGRIR